MKEKPKPDTADMGAGEPWRCTSCGWFVYNIGWLDGRYCPVGGASASKYISINFPKVCCVCYDLYHNIIQEDYWKNVQDTENAKVRKLRSGSDYLGV
jgi:hypothetical protein